MQKILDWSCIIENETYSLFNKYRNTKHNSFFDHKQVEIGTRSREFFFIFYPEKCHMITIFLTENVRIDSYKSRIVNSPNCWENQAIRQKLSGVASRIPLNMVRKGGQDVLASYQHVRIVKYIGRHQILSPLARIKNSLHLNICKMSIWNYLKRGGIIVRQKMAPALKPTVD